MHIHRYYYNCLLVHIIAVLSLNFPNSFLLYILSLQEYILSRIKSVYKINHNFFTMNLKSSELYRCSYWYFKNLYQNYIYEHKVVEKVPFYYYYRNSETQIFIYWYSMETLRKFYWYFEILFKKSLHAYSPSRKIQLYECYRNSETRILVIDKCCIMRTFVKKIEACIGFSCITFVKTHNKSLHFKILKLL